MSKDPPSGISVDLIDDDVFKWEVLIVGGVGTML